MKAHWLVFDLATREVRAKGFGSEGDFNIQVWPEGCGGVLVLLDAWVKGELPPEMANS